MSTFKADFNAFCEQAGTQCKLRLAPTPSGFLHIGNALNFLLTWHCARQNGGKLVLRIDDLDSDRKRPEYVQDIFDSLRWLGIDWDEGPLSPEDFEQNWSQKHRLPLYFDALEALKSNNTLFACAKSRSELSHFQGEYPSIFRDQGLSLDSPDVCWRLKTPPEFPLPDFVVRRRDGIPAYQITSVADDLYFGITHIIRGIDRAPSTAAQQYLGGLLPDLRFNEIQCLHHPLLLDHAGQKLSKSAGATSLKSMRDAGLNPEDLKTELLMPYIT